MQVLEFEKKKIVVNNTWAGVMAAYVHDNMACNHISNGATYEADLVADMLEPYIKRSRTIVDVGAHTGHHSIPYAKFNPEAKIHAFEPQKDLFNLFLLNIMNNPHCKNIHPYNLALGNKHCATTFAPPPETDWAKDKVELSIVHLGEGGEEVNMMTLDSLNLQECDYIKIDVEGAEPLVIEGAIETIKKFRPVICFEYYEDSDQTDGYPEMFKKGLEKTTHEKLEELEYVIHPLVYNNFLALPLVKSKFKNLSGCPPKPENNE